MHEPAQHAVAVAQPKPEPGPLTGLQPFGGIRVSAPFAGGITWEPRPSARERYTHVLIDRLEKLEVPHESAQALMDRIERMLGVHVGAKQRNALAPGDGQASEPASV